MSKIGLDMEKVNAARASALAIARDTQEFVQRHTTVSVERTICRLLGIDGIDGSGIPLPNLVVDHLKEQGALGNGAAFYLSNAMLEAGKSPQEIAEEVASGRLDLTRIPVGDRFEIALNLETMAKETTMRIRENRKVREAYLGRFGDKEGPYLYVIVATGNIYEDIVQARAAARQGADIIAVIRSTGQSLLDYVPYGATTEGFGGTMATQENFRLMRKALDEVGEELGRYIRLCNYCSGLCMPEIAAMGAMERLDVMLNDALYGILFRDINMKRTMIDQYFSRAINGYAGIIINTGEDNYLTTADAFEEAHTVLASQFINEQFALLAGIPEEQMGLGHAFEMDPALKNGFLFELSQAQMAREIFPKAPLKYMPPTKFLTGDIFKGQVQNTLFNMVTIMTGQKLHLLGMMTEAIHTPFMADRAAAIDNARYVFSTMEDFGEEIEFRKGGIIQSRAADVLAETVDLLKTIEKDGLFRTLEAGRFANIRRPQDGGKGLDGVAEKGRDYLNPFFSLLLEGRENR